MRTVFLKGTASDRLVSSPAARCWPMMQKHRCMPLRHAAQHSNLSQRRLVLPQAGYKVAGIDKIRPEGLDTDAVLEQHASSLLFINADLQDEVQLEDAAKQACIWLGTVNVLVNNSGIAQPYMPGTKQERSKLWHSYIATNLTGGLAA